MEWSRQTVRGLLEVVCGGVAFAWLLRNLPSLVQAVGWLVHILAPFLLGGVIAFILNVPMRAIERRLPVIRRRRGSPRPSRPLALILTVAAVVGVLGLCVGVVAPGVADAVRSISGQLPAAFDRLTEQMQAVQSYLPQVETWFSGVEIDWSVLSQKLISMAQSWGSGLLTSGSGLLGGLVSGVSSFVIGLIFSFYILLQKEKLSRQGKQVLYALLPERAADRTLEILTLSEQVFSRFLSGQCLEACILGTLFAVSMTIFRMPYALLVGGLVAVTALIPIVGAFIGCAVGALLIAVMDPWKALWFVVLFLVLQQIEGHLIYPNVVGSSVGLPSIWVLMAVTLGGRLFGIAGMLFFIPLCSVVYALFRSFVKTRLRLRAVSPDKWTNAS